MKKVLIICTFSLFTGMYVQAQSASGTENSESTQTKKQTELKQVTKINKTNVAVNQNLKKARLANQVQPVKKEEEVKSIETNQK